MPIMVLQGTYTVLADSIHMQSSETLVTARGMPGDRAVQDPAATDLQPGGGPTPWGSHRGPSRLSWGDGGRGELE